MLSFFVVIIYALAVGYSIFFIWFLFWPSAIASVSKYEESQVKKSEMSSAFSSNTHQIRVVCYGYEYNGVQYNSTRQGLFRAAAGIPICKVGDNFQIKVCPIFPKLCAPNRKIYEGKILSFLVFSLLIGAVIVNYILN